MSNQVDYEFQVVEMVKQPVDGLVVTLADRSPLPRVLKADQEICFGLNCKNRRQIR